MRAAWRISRETEGYTADDASGKGAASTGGRWNRHGTSASHDLGEQWIGESRSAILLVPSGIIPEEYNVLINPNHADMSQIETTKLRKWIYDFRLIRQRLT